jgi:hypothetical protein
MTPEQAQQWADELGWPVDTVQAWFTYVHTGQAM